MIKYALIAGGLAILSSTSAFAVDLTVNQKQPILMPDGKTPMLVCDEWSTDAKPVCNRKSPKTVGVIIQDVLTAQLIDPQTHGQDSTNAKSGALAIRLYGVDAPTLKLDEISLILGRVDKTEDPVTIARMHEILEPEKKS